jgi:hypothetical protein
MARPWPGPRCSSARGRRAALSRLGRAGIQRGRRARAAPGGEVLPRARLALVVPPRPRDAVWLRPSLHAEVSYADVAEGLIHLPGRRGSGPPRRHRGLSRKLAVAGAVRVRLPGRDGPLSRLDERHRRRPQARRRTPRLSSATECDGARRRTTGEIESKPLRNQQVGGRPERSRLAPHPGGLPEHVSRGGRLRRRWTRRKFLLL